MNTFDPNTFDPETEAIRQRMAYAQALRAQSQTPPQGQMMGGVFVRPHATQYLANLLSAYRGAQGEQQARADMAGLAAQRKEQGAADITNLMNAMKGQQATPGTDATGSSPVGPSGAFGGPDYGTLARIAATTRNPEVARMAAKSLEGMAKGPEWKEFERPDGKGGFERGFVNMNASNPVSTFQAGGMMPAKMEHVDTGGQIVGWNPYAPPQGPIQKTFTPDAMLTDQRARAEGALNRGVTMRGQNMTDARSRESNGLLANGLVPGSKAALQLQLLQDKVDQVKQAKASALSSIENNMAVLDKAMSHPGREISTGKSGAFGLAGMIPGTDAADFKAVLDQIKGASFMQAYQSLRGGGQITEVEGKKATDAIARLSTSQSDKEFLRSLQDLQDVMRAGYARAGGGQSAQPTPGGAQMPAAQRPAQNSGIKFMGFEK